MRDYRFAARMQRLSGEGAFEVLSKARALEQQGREIIHLEIGEPDFKTPSNIEERGHEALGAGKTHYSPSAGILPLRESIARHIQTTRNVTVSPASVVAAPGGKPMIFFLLSTLIESGDEVLFPSPAYPAYESVVNYLGGTPIPIPVLEERNFRFDLPQLVSRITPRTRLLILNSPQNPTGAVLTREDLRSIAEIAEKKDLLILSDEIYSRISYEARCPSIIEMPGMLERTLLVDGFSKSHAMTGWRLGYGVMPEPIAQKVTQLIVNSTSCVTTFVQWAGIEALEGPQDAVETMVAEFKRRRDFIVDGLNSLPGVTCQTPPGAFYAFPNVRQLGLPARQLANFFLEEAGVACLGGTAFGTMGEGYLRFSYANSQENIEKAIEKMRSALSRLPTTVAHG